MRKAASDQALYFNSNHGGPAVVATQHPADFQQRPNTPQLEPQCAPIRHEEVRQMQRAVQKPDQPHAPRIAEPSRPHIPKQVEPQHLDGPHGPKQNINDHDERAPHGHEGDHRNVPCHQGKP